MESLDQAVREMRLLVQFGTPPGVAEDFVGTLERLIKTTEDLSQIAMVFGVQGNERLESLPTEKKVALYRVLQEALSNVVRHSKAAEAVVRVEADRSKARLVVRDNGVGFDTAQSIQGGHFGLQGFKARAEAEGGACDIQSKPGAGTTIAFEIPYE
ncbi:MAG: two-component system, NarL family, sensor histidine kinase DegS [Chloroflexi bacterium]|jgi:signal transduction histidine kinase|nr:MAG: two-component system, NarL family, sensor histidine kinase DegS [Chloroflexota bacterium]